MMCGCLLARRVWAAVMALFANVPYAALCKRSFSGGDHVKFLFAVRITIDNPEMLLKPGTLADATFR